MTVEAPSELVVTTREELRQRILAHLAAGHDVDVDLSHAGYVDTAAVGMLLRCSRVAREAGRRLVLKGCSAELREYFRLPALGGRLELEGA